MRTSDASERLAVMMREEAAAAEDAGDGHSRLLRHLASTMDRMTPAERTWVEEASDDELRNFARALREGCPAEEPGAGS